MNIGLIDPSAKRTALPMPHLGLAYVAGALERAGHRVKVLDLDLSTPAEVDRFLAEPFELLGATVASFTFRRALEAVRAYKKKHPQTPVVLGGPHVSLELEKVFDSPEVDFGVYGEGELTVVELAWRLEKGDEPSLSEVPGLIYRDGDRVVVNLARAKNRELDALAFPSYSSLAMERYEVYPVITSRGCPYQCTFCTVPLVDGNQWRERSARNVVAELEALTSRYGRKRVAFCDDNFNGRVDRVNELCARLIESRLSLEWFCWSFRADRADPEMLRAMRRAGCNHVSVGLESADPQVLKDVKKRLTLKKVEDGVANIRAAGIACQTLNMIGNVGDTLETVKATIAFNRSLKIDGALFHLAVPYPKTELWAWVDKNARWLKSDYTQFHHFSAEPIFETDDFTRDERLQAYRLARRFELEVSIRSALRRKWAKLREGGLKAISRRDIWKSLRSLGRQAFDYAFAHDRKLVWKGIRLKDAAQTRDLDAVGAAGS